MGGAHRITRKPRARSSALNYLFTPTFDQQIGAFVEHYNHVRYHESIENVTPADVYFGRAQMILAERRRIKLATIANRRLHHRLQAA
jgi:putative transposase